MAESPSNGQITHSYDENQKGNLADHFLNCAKLGRYLTVASGTRFIITDDFRGENIVTEAAAMAAIYSRDSLVAEAALLPLSQTIPIMDTIQRDKFERLFHLIEDQTLTGEVKDAAQSLIGSRFRAAEIRALETELGSRISPARIRYREFLLVVKRLMEREMREEDFLEEFRSFTQDIAGKLDFGIYSFCLDSMFNSQKISVTVKKLLALEILNYPPLIRRELLSNIIAFPGQTEDLINFIFAMIERYLAIETVIEIKLLKDIKLRKFSMDEVSALVESSSVKNQ